MDGWVCNGCHSLNERVATRCYTCGLSQKASYRTDPSRQSSSGSPSIAFGQPAAKSPKRRPRRTLLVVVAGAALAASVVGIAVAHGLPQGGPSNPPPTPNPHASPTRDPSRPTADDPVVERFLDVILAPAFTARETTTIAMTVAGRVELRSAEVTEIAGGDAHQRARLVIPAKRIDQQRESIALGDRLFVREGTGTWIDEPRTDAVRIGAFADLGGSDALHYLGPIKQAGERLHRIEWPRLAELVLGEFLKAVGGGSEVDKVSATILVRADGTPVRVDVVLRGRVNITQSFVAEAHVIYDRVGQPLEIMAPTAAR